MLKPRLHWYRPECDSLLTVVRTAQDADEHDVRRDASALRAPGRRGGRAPRGGDCRRGRVAALAHGPARATRGACASRPDDVRTPSRLSDASASSLYLGDASAAEPDEKVACASVPLKLRLLQELAKSVTAAGRFPRILQVLFDAVFNSALVVPRLRLAGMAFLQVPPPPHISERAPTWDALTCNLVVSQTCT